MTKRYDLEERSLRFTRDVFAYVQHLPQSLTNHETSKQLIRSASSIGANYREANEAPGRKDFLMRLRIARREAKETVYWLEFTECSHQDLETKARLTDEANQLMRILGSIISKSEGGIPKKVEASDA